MARRKKKNVEQRRQHGGSLLFANTDFFSSKELTVGEGFFAGVAVHAVCQNVVSDVQTRTIRTDGNEINMR